MSKSLIKASNSEDGRVLISLAAHSPEGMVMNIALSFRATDFLKRKITMSWKKPHVAETVNRG